MNIKELFSLKDKCAVIFGGFGKIGFPITEGLLEAGAKVYVISRNAKKNKDKISKLSNYNSRLITYNADHSNEKQVKKLVKFLASQNEVPSILVNCAVERPMKKLMDDSAKNWDRSMNINSRSLFITTKLFAKAMTSNQGGSIINVASIYGIVAPKIKIYKGTNLGTEPDYPYTKGGMIMYSKYLAAYYAKSNIRVNVIAPGGFYANQEKKFLKQYIDMVPLDRMATHDDLKGVAVFLASQASSYITGAIIPVDGGFTI